METPKTSGLRQVALSPEEFLRAGPKPVDNEYGWAGKFWDRDMIDDGHPIYRAPIPRPSADEFANALQALAGTDTPKHEFPVDFFTRDIVHGD